MSASRSPRRTALLVAALIAAGLVAGFAYRYGLRHRGAAPTAADLAAIGKLRAAYLDAHNEGDADRLAALFTDDAVLAPPDDATCEGRDAIADYFDDLLRDEPSTAEFDVQETRVDGDWAFERIDVTLDGTDPDTGEATETWARYFWVLRRQTDGAWKIDRLMYNIEEPEDDSDDTRGESRQA